MERNLDRRSGVSREEAGVRGARRRYYGDERGRDRPPGEATFRPFGQEDQFARIVVTFRLVGANIVGFGRFLADTGMGEVSGGTEHRRPEQGP